MKNKICKCGHEKRWHSLVFQACIFPDKTENWDMPEKAKKEYLRLGITELAVCTCRKFKPQEDSDIVYDDGDVQVTREDYEKGTGSDNSPQDRINGTSPSPRASSEVGRETGSTPESEDTLSSKMKELREVNENLRHIIKNHEKNVKELISERDRILIRNKAFIKKLKRKWFYCSGKKATAVLKSDIDKLAGKELLE